ncbi:MAG TPA: peptide chain release factor 2, partial [Patescibacteria group bacterium]|nr:peptide chain release factor 2 [Patescibacteria group bacterium]
LQQKSNDPNLWKNKTDAQSIMVEISKLENAIQPWQALQNEYNELRELIELNDDKIEEEIKENLKIFKHKYTNLKKDLMFDGPYDHRDAYLNIYAGAGGTDAQDWAQMLLRMYTKWTEKKDFKTKIIQISQGEEAGIKSVTLEIDGKLVYGKLKGEQGVHRLVRLSPYNADNLRQTSFAKVEILPKISLDQELDIEDKDIKIDVFRSGGRGGQSVNTTDSAVRLTHLPTGITINIQNERSQLQNRQTAMSILKSKLAALILEQHKDHLNDIKGPNQSAEWGNQIRNYVLHPYKQVKDLRTKVQTTDVEGVLNGDIDEFINSNE